ncbi:hypothetical protein [Desulfosporosinus sp. OT]|uniref:hypothetical protein n=1 Tax=Desulfosporosinus sp. OT TaxID=913865 RepID=UPI000223A104|nr:hypothetical protein [Desulfosporosinus sp. OT]EGW40721.1 putative membrane protein [Desulfosporosinus sp. OT]
MVRIKKSLILKAIIYILFGLGAIITIFIIRESIDDKLAFKFVIGYLSIVFLLALYFWFITILNMKELKWIEMRKKSLKFIGMFVTSSVLIIVLDYFFRPSKIDFIRTFSITLGTSFGMSFYDLKKR